MRTRDERFWAKVDTNGPVPPHVPHLGQCWVWLGAKWRSNGRPTFSWSHDRPMSAYRAAWALTHGPIPDGTWVLHKCDNGSCVRPEHLFLGTQRDNMLDAIAKGRHTSDVRRGRPNPRVAGERNAIAKLTAASVAAIRRAHASGASQKVLAAKYGISQSLVSLVVLRKAWRHVA